MSEGTLVTTKLRCPKCRSADLNLVESATWLTEWHVRGGMFDRDEQYPNPSSIDRVDAACVSCGHFWKPRKAWQIDDLCEEVEASHE